MTRTQVLAMPPIPTIRVENTSTSPPHKTTSSCNDRDLRAPPSFLPPDLPLPSPGFVAMASRMAIPNTPIASPIASPFRAAPSKLVDNLVLEEAAYLEELLVLQNIIKEELLGHELDALAAPVEKMIDLASELNSQLVQKTSYFSDSQKDCLIHFSKVAGSSYQAYIQSFRLNLSLGLTQSAERIRLMELLDSLDKFGEADRDLDWLLRRPLSRLRSYSNLYKKLLHSSDDATDMFLAYETFHGLLIEAREALDIAREQCDPSASAPVSKVAQRSVSGGSTSTQSSSNSKVSTNDELLGLQDTLDTAHCKDIFSLALAPCRLSLLPKESDSRRALVNRSNFQLRIHHASSDEIVIDCLVELILLTDQLLIVRPTFERPQLMFPPLQRGVFHVSPIPSESRILELDIVGRQTLRLTAATKEARNHWHELLLACEDYKLDTMPVAPPTLAQYVGGRAHHPWLPLAPTRMPPTPPHTGANAPCFGNTAPLRVIRENSQLSMGDVSDCSARTPDTKEHAPFHFDILDDEAIPKAVESTSDKGAPPRPLRENADIANRLVPRVVTSKQAVTPLKHAGLSFPEPPRRSSVDRAAAMTKSKSVDLFDASSYTDQFLRARPLGTRSKTLDLPKTPEMTYTDAESPEPESDAVFDLSTLDLPTLPAFDFGDGIRRPSSVALDFSPNTMSNFGIPVRKVKAPAPMVIPDVAPLKVSPQKAKGAETLSQRRLGSDLSLAAPRPSPPTPSMSERENLFLTMAECYSWVNGTWTPILMDDVDKRGKMKTVRSSRVTIFFNGASNGFLEIYDPHDQKVVKTFGVFGSTSIIRDDPCDISAGFDVGFDKVYYMFRAENPDKANALQHALNQAKFAAPQQGFVTPVLPVTPLWPEHDSSAAAVESLKIKLYLFDNGKWINKGSARLTIWMISQSRNRRVTLTAKTKKNNRMMLVDYIAVPGDCDALSKTSISLRTKTETYMMQFKGGEKERAKILDILVD